MIKMVIKMHFDNFHYARSLMITLTLSNGGTGGLSGNQAEANHILKNMQEHDNTSDLLACIGLNHKSSFWGGHHWLQRGERQVHNGDRYWYSRDYHWGTVIGITFWPQTWGCIYAIWSKSYSTSPVSMLWNYLRQILWFISCHWEKSRLHRIYLANVETTALWM